MTLFWYIVNMVRASICLCCVITFFLCLFVSSVIDAGWTLATRQYLTQVDDFKSFNASVRVYTEQISGPVAYVRWKPSPVADSLLGVTRLLTDAVAHGHTTEPFVEAFLICAFLKEYFALSTDLDSVTKLCESNKFIMVATVTTGISICPCTSE